MCWVWEVDCKVKEGLSGFLTTVYDAIAKTIGDLAKGLGTFWVETPTVPLGDTAGKAAEPVAFIQSHLSWYTGAILVFAMLYTAGQMMWQRNGRPLTEGLATLLKFTLVTGAGIATTVLLLNAGDEYSKWVIKESTPNSNFGNAILALFAISSAALSSGPGMMMFVIIIGIVTILISVIQIGLLIVRSAMAIMLAGTLPIAFSATNTSWGKQWSQKHTGWLIAFILYKPVASTIYAAAFKIIGSFGSKDGDIGQQMVSFTAGIVLMVGALVALPALMRLIVPAVGAAAAGSSMFAGGAIGGGASGAINAGVKMTSKSNSGGKTEGSSGGGSGESSPSGATAAKGASSGGSGAGAGAGGGAAAGGAAAAVPVIGAAVMAAKMTVDAGKKVAEATNQAISTSAGEGDAPQPNYSSGSSAPQEGGGATGTKNARNSGNTGNNHPHSHQQRAPQNQYNNAHNKQQEGPSGSK